MLTPDDLQRFMESQGISGELLFLKVPTPTVEAAAQALGTTPENIIKTVLFTIGEEHLLAIASGTLPIDRRRIAAHFGVGRKRVKLADPKTVLEVTGYPVGTVPPFGHKHPSHTLMDPRVLKREVAYAGGGAHNALVRLNPTDILRVTQGTVVELIHSSI